MVTIVAPFADEGTPATGLSPTIRIRRTDTQVLVVTDAAMTEQGEGLYSYDFTDDETLEYSVRADGGGSLADIDRYVYGSHGTALVRLTSDGLDAVRDAILDDATRFSGADVTTMRKIANNRLELADGSTSNWVLYDDDDSTPLLTYDVADKDGNAVAQVAGAPSRRTRGV